MIPLVGVVVVDHVVIVGITVVGGKTFMTPLIEPMYNSHVILKSPIIFSKPMYDFFSEERGVTPQNKIKGATALYKNKVVDPSEKRPCAKFEPLVTNSFAKNGQKRSSVFCDFMFWAF